MAHICGPTMVALSVRPINSPAGWEIPPIQTGRLSQRNRCAAFSQQKDAGERPIERAGVDSVENAKCGGGCQGCGGAPLRR